MITADHPLIQLLALIEMVWVEAENVAMRRGAPKYYLGNVTFESWSELW